MLGRLSDRNGRKAGLTVSVGMMSASALMIALAPNYETAGNLGACLLVTARILQGLSVGGEYAASAAYLTEVSKKGWRGLGASFQYISVTLGQLAGLLVLIVLQFSLSEEQLTSWGWRVPFAMGAIGAVAVFYLRRGMHETTAYSVAETVDTEDRRGTLAEVWRNRRAAVVVFTLTLGGTVAYYTYTTYLTSYFVNSVGLEKSQASTISFIGLLVFLVLLPIVDTSPTASAGGPSSSSSASAPRSERIRSCRECRTIPRGSPAWCSPSSAWCSWWGTRRSTRWSRPNCSPPGYERSVLPSVQHRHRRVRGHCPIHRSGVPRRGPGELVLHLRLDLRGHLTDHLRVHA